MSNCICLSLAEIKQENCFIIENNLLLKTTKSDWIMISAELSLLQDRAILAEVIREWIAERNWKIWHTPISREHSIVIDVGYDEFYSTIHSSYTEAIFQTYISAVKGEKK